MVLSPQVLVGGLALLIASSSTFVVIAVAVYQKRKNVNDHFGKSFKVYLAAAGIALSAFTASGALSISSELIKWNEDLKGRIDHAADALLACGRFVVYWILLEVISSSPWSELGPSGRSISVPSNSAIVSGLTGHGDTSRAPKWARYTSMGLSRLLKCVLFAAMILSFPNEGSALAVFSASFGLASHATAMGFFMFIMLDRRFNIIANLKRTVLMIITLVLGLIGDACALSTTVVHEQQAEARAYLALFGKLLTALWIVFIWAWIIMYLDDLMLVNSCKRITENAVGSCNHIPPAPPPSRASVRCSNVGDDSWVEISEFGEKPQNQSPTHHRHASGAELQDEFHGSFRDRPTPSMRTSVDLPTPDSLTLHYTASRWDGVDNDPFSKNQVSVRRSVIRSSIQSACNAVEVASWKRRASLSLVDWPSPTSEMTTLSGYNAGSHEKVALDDEVDSQSDESGRILGLAHEGAWPVCKSEGANGAQAAGATSSTHLINDSLAIGHDFSGFRQQLQHGAHISSEDVPDAGYLLGVAISGPDIADPLVKIATVAQPSRQAITKQGEGSASPLGSRSSRRVKALST